MAYKAQDLLALLERNFRSSRSTKATSPMPASSGWGTRFGWCIAKQAESAPQVRQPPAVVASFVACSWLRMQARRTRYAEAKLSTASVPKP